jgi:hypothetical protein
MEPSPAQPTTKPSTLDSVGVLWRPHAAFAAVLRSPALWLTMAIVLAVATLPAVAFVTTQNVEQHIRREMKFSGAWEKLPESMRDQTLAASVAISTVGMPVGAAALRGIAVLFAALMCLLIAGTHSQKPNVLAVFAGVALAHAPLLVRDVLQAVMIATTREVNLAQNPLLSSPAALLDETQARTWWGVLLSGVDVFSIWSIILVGIGMQVITRGTKRPFIIGAIMVTVAQSLPSVFAALGRP